jgi:hypothetical protein
MPKYHNIKVKVTGPDIVEVQLYVDGGFWTGRQSNGGRNGDGKDKEKNRKDVGRRRRQAVIDTANCNFNVQYAKFLTLTFAENMTDIATATKQLNRFLVALRRKYHGFRYLWVVEFQKRGAVHFHVLMDIQEKIPLEWLQERWGQGFIKLNVITHVDNIGAYIGKYMAKHNDERLDGHRAYGMARDMAEAQTYSGKAAELICGAFEGKERPVHCGEYTGKYVGHVIVHHYNLKRKKNAPSEVSKGVGAS